MPDNALQPTRQDDGYEEFARKMRLFEDGPTTTNFQQLLDKGVDLPAPEAVTEADIRTKLWQVIHGLSELRVYLSESDHLSDKELYARLWNDTLRAETPAIDDIGFNHHVQLLTAGDDADTTLYLKFYADQKWRDHWREDFPDFAMPAHEDPPFNRDVLLPRPDYEGGPEALEWLRANHNPSALATNRFPTTAHAVAFVEQLYVAGATDVWVENIMMLPNHHWTPYADTLIVDLPEDGEHRRAVFELIEYVGKPDEGGPDDYPLTDCGRRSIRLWWD